MKKSYVTIGLLLLALGARAALPQPDLIAQIHFAGAQKISTDAHSKAITNEFGCAEALALRTQTADKLSRWLAGWLHTNLNANVAEDPAKLRPLFDDLQTAEWFLEARAAANARPEIAIAIKLDPARAQLWQANLKPFFASAAFKSVGGWLIFDSDPALLKLGDRLAQKISTPPAGWLDLDINWPRLAQWYPELKGLRMPETVFTLTPLENNLQIDGKFYFPENLALNLEPWRVPTNTLHAPFDSFTAVRGFAPWLESQKWAQPYRLQPTPNQLFVWSQPSLQLQTFYAVPVPDAPKSLSQIYPGMAQSVMAANARGGFMSPVNPVMTNNEINVRGLPMVAMNLRALSEPAGQFLFLEMFPNISHGKPLPAELFSQLATKNLVFYHWELTAERMPQLLHLTQFGLMFTMHKQLDAGSAGFKWLQKIGPTLGNNGTLITQSGPAEFKFERTAPGIFTAMELYALANWLEAKDFPGCDLKLPPRRPRASFAHPQQFNLTPMSPAPGH